MYQVDLPIAGAHNQCVMCPGCLSSESFAVFMIRYTYSMSPIAHQSRAPCRWVLPAPDMKLLSVLDSQQRNRALIVSYALHILGLTVSPPDTHIHLLIAAILIGHCFFFPMKCYAWLTVLTNTSTWECDLFKNLVPKVKPHFIPGIMREFE